MKKIMISIILCIMFLSSNTFAVGLDVLNISSQYYKIEDMSEEIYVSTDSLNISVKYMIILDKTYFNKSNIFNFSFDPSIEKNHGIIQNYNLTVGYSNNRPYYAYDFDYKLNYTQVYNTYKHTINLSNINESQFISISINYIVNDFFYYPEEHNNNVLKFKYHSDNFIEKHKIYFHFPSNLNLLKIPDVSNGIECYGDPIVDCTIEERQALFFEYEDLDKKYTEENKIKFQEDIFKCITFFMFIIFIISKRDWIIAKIKFYETYIEEKNLIPNYRSNGLNKYFKPNNKKQNNKYDFKMRNKFKH